jgi:hypothetical protein
MKGIVNFSMNSAGVIDAIETPSGTGVIGTPCGGSFNYGDLSTDLATALRGRATRIREKARATTLGIIAIGQDLLAAKKELARGQFLIWAETECGLSIRTADNYMRAAKFAATFMESGKLETVSNLPAALIYKLGAKSTPPEIIGEVISVAESRGVVSEGAVRKKLAKAAAERLQAERQAKRQARKTRRGSKAAHEREELERQDREREQKATEAAVASWLNQVGEKAGKATCDLFKAAAWPWGLVDEIEKQLRERAA